MIVEKDVRRLARTKAVVELAMKRQRLMRMKTKVR
jgi:hypothetical protein